MPKIESYQLNNGLTRYRFQLHAGRSPLTGKRLVTRRSGFRSRRAAQVELTRLQSQLERNGTINSVTPVSRKRTFKNVYEEWLPIYKRRVKAITFRYMRKNCERHILPVFGDDLIDKIEARDLQKFVNQVADKYQSFHRFTSLLTKVFHFAAKMGYIEIDPMTRIDVPKSRHSKKKL